MKMMTSLVILSMTLVLTGCGDGGSSAPQAYAITKTFGGTDNENARSVQQTVDGGFVLAGTAAYFEGGSDMYLVRTDAQGNKLWEKTFGGTGYDYAYSVQQTADGGFVLAGSADSFGPIGAGGSYMYLVRTDAQGNKLWEKTFGDAGHDCAFSVQQTADGGFALAGTGRFVLTDAQGNKLWERTFGGSIWAMQLTGDGGFVLAGETIPPGSLRCAYLVRTDAQGNLIWEKTFGDAFSAKSVKQTADGGFVLVGETTLGYFKFYLARTDASGNRLWKKAFGSGGLDWNTAEDVQTTTDGGFVIAGSTSEYGVRGDAYLVRTDAQGNMLWHKIYGGEYGDEACSIQQTADGGFVLGGQTVPFGSLNPDAFLIRMDAQGNPKS